jgi:sulfate permease, SulP family
MNGWSDSHPVHPPLNVPALGMFSRVALMSPYCFIAVSLDQEVDTNQELVSHGYSNVLAGLAGKRSC